MFNHPTSDTQSDKWQVGLIWFRHSAALTAIQKELVLMKVTCQQRVDIGTLSLLRNGKEKKVV